MSGSSEASEQATAGKQTIKLVLNAGSGPRSSSGLHQMFAKPSWHEVRIDIDHQTNPDLVGSIVDMTSLITTGSYDAVWSSHSLEHLFAHQVPSALSEFLRILKPSGFALITCPDLEAVAALIVERGLDQTAYVSALGPITSHDMLFGHSASIAQGKEFMAHKTGFSWASLGRLLATVGFAEVLIKRQEWDLWALALMEEADKIAIQRALKTGGLDMYEQSQ
jgi:SAM-dependent methyltransferase